MRYRQLGATGLSVSEIGLGCEGFTEGEETTRALIDLAEKNGVNYIDLYSSDPSVRSSLGAALQGRRENFLLQAHLCTTWDNGQYRRTRKISEAKERFEDLLLRLKTDFIDVGMIHYVDSTDDWRKIASGEVMRYALSLKREGKIGCIGMSSHNPEAALEAVRSGLLDVLMFSVNPCYDLLPGDEDCETLWAEDSYKNTLTNMDPAREELYEECQRRGVGITVMKVFGGGDLLTDDSPAGKALTEAQCIHYALTRPAVACVLPGAHSAEEFSRCLAYETTAAEERDYAAAFASFRRISWSGRCMYCGHCAPCAAGIDVATVTKLFNLAKTKREIPETVREHYLTLDRKAGDCLECGACETRCPFGVKVIESMRAARALFGK